MQKKKRFNNTANALLLLRLNPLKFEYKRSEVTAVVPIQKTNGKARYNLKIHLDRCGYYSIYVIEPKLKKIDNESPPHIYKHKSKWNEDTQEYDECCLCLHLPGSDEYDRNKSLLQTAIAWAIKWTEFYELWLLTGVWYGGGIHPEKDKKDNTQEIANEECN